MIKKRKTWQFLFILFLVQLIFSTAVYADRNNDRNIYHPETAKKIIKSLEKTERIQISQYVSNDVWTWIQVKWYDEEYPIMLDFLFSNNAVFEKIAYLIAPGGFNFQNAFFTPIDRNIAHFMRENEYLVIGITHREDFVPIEQAGEFMRKWGMEKHRKDLRKVVKRVRKVIKIPYDMLGQANSAVCILDYAAKYSDKFDTLDKLILLDTDSFDPAIQPQKITYANMCYDAMNQLLDQGVMADSFISDMCDLIMAAAVVPQEDSGQSREWFGFPDNFTVEGLLHFSLVYTTSLPGLHTPITGLPGEWTMVQGAAAGYYEFADNPTDDNYALTRTDMADLQKAAMLSGTGTMPLALGRDIYAILALNGQYRIDWSEINEKVIMVNSEYSAGYQTYYGTLIKQGGNEEVEIHIVPDYGYVDLLYAPSAEEDVWQFFLD